jgi:hypothetical protein
VSGLSRDPPHDETLMMLDGDCGEIEAARPVTVYTLAELVVVDDVLPGTVLINSPGFLV